MNWDAARQSRLACAALVLLLSACGGGGDAGGGGGGTPNPPAVGLTVNPTGIAFAAPQNGPLPPAQNVQVTLTRADVFTVTARFAPSVSAPSWLPSTPQLTGSGANWTLNGSVATTALAPGTYTTTLRVEAKDASQAVLAFSDVQVSYTVQSPGSLLANPSGLTFSQLKGAPPPASQSVGIADPAGGSYAWSASVIYQSGSGWLSINAGSTASGGSLPGSLSVTVAPPAAAGTYSATIRVSWVGPTLDIPVMYTVSDPLITPSRLSLSFNALRLGASPATQDVTLNTQNGVPVPYSGAVSYGPGATGWLNAPATGAAPSVATVGVNTTTLAPGTYTANLTLSTSGQVFVVAVTYTVAEPTLTRAPSQLTFNAASTGTTPPAQDVTLSTQQNVNLAYSTSIIYGAGATGWLSAPSGTAPGPLSVSVNTTNLAPGTYTANLTVRSSGQVLTVSVTYVVATSALSFSPAAPGFVLDTTSLASALSQSVTVGSTGVALGWTAVSSEPWLTVSPSSGTSGSPVTLNVVQAQLEALEAGARSATITFSYTPPKQTATIASLPVSLDLRLPKVRSVNPYVATSGTSLEVILRGSGFNSAGGTPVNFDTTAVSSYTVMSDTELRVIHPSLAAGSYRVTLPNQLGLPRSTADLLVVDAPGYAATTLDYPTVPATALPRVPMKIFYDAERRALVVVVGYQGAGTVAEIHRYAFSGSAWSPTPITVSLPTVPGLPLIFGVAPTLDGKKLLVASNSTIQEFDMATLAAGTSTSTGLFASVFSHLALANDGVAIVTSTGLDTFKYSVADRTLTEIFTPFGSLFCSFPGGSADGSLVAITQQCVTPSPPVVLYDASTSTLSETNLDISRDTPVLDRGATRMMLSGFEIYDRNMTLLGTIPHADTLSPDGKRAYGANQTVLHTYDLTGSPPAGLFPEIGPVTSLPGDLGGGGAVTVSPDGGTVFIAGPDRIVVVPAP